jgi:hypothetical protein
VPHIIIEYAEQLVGDDEVVTLLQAIHHLAGLSALNINASVITVEIIDMDRDSYGKHVPELQ